MSVLPIRLYGDPVLHRQAEEIDQFDSEISDLTADMIETAQVDVGVGLAGPQVGEGRRLIIVSNLDEEGTFHAYVNPVILDRGGTEVEEEGCLSVPDVRSKVDRSSWVKVQAYDLSGNRLELEATGLQARIFQHEIDHLDGILFIQRIPRAKRFLLKGTLERIRKESASWRSQDAGDRK